MSDIALTFINQSSDTNNSQVVIFARNVAVPGADSTVAWRVLRHPAKGARASFAFSRTCAVEAADPYGKCTSQLPAQPGQLFQISKHLVGHIIAHKGPASSPEQIQMKNILPVGAIDARLYKDGKLLALHSGIAPGQMAAFAFAPVLYFGLVSLPVREGQLLTPALASHAPAEINLAGLASADIVMSGGGSALPIRFHLANTVEASAGQYAGACLP